MKKSETNRGVHPFLSMRSVCMESGDSFCVYLPKKWCLKQGIRHLTNVKILVFPKVLLVIPPGKQFKLSEFARDLPGSVMTMKLWEELRNAMKEVERAVEESKRKLTRDERDR